MDEKSLHNQDSSDRSSEDLPGRQSDLPYNNPQENIRDQSQGSMNSIKPNLQDDPTMGVAPANPLMDRPGQIPTINKSMQSEAESTGQASHLWITREEVDELRARWNAIQVQFIDSPCSAVEQGDTLVAETLDRVKQAMAEHQNSLNQQWINHDDISTEELRITLQNYRAFLDRLLKL